MPQLKTILRVETKLEIEQGVRYYISDCSYSAVKFARRIRGYWGVENKVHYVIDVTVGEDKSRIRTKPLPQFMSNDLNLAINLYRDAGFDNMAKAKRECQFYLDRLKEIFRMK